MGKMKKFKSVITEFSQESEVVDSWDGSFTSGYLGRIGIEDVEISSGQPLDRGEFLGKEVTIIIGDSESEVPKQELPIIPKYVADWIEEEQGTMSNWKLPSRFISDSKYKKDQRRYRWSQVEGNMDKFMSALINSYEVEKDKLYVVELSNSNEKFGNYENVFLNKKDGVVFIDSCRLFINDIKKYSQFGLTEKEIKDYDERFWLFAVEVDICNK